jgi:N-acetylglucosaminyl-diphospho-decaprenol L-rhamnosyltransferase
MTDDTRTQAAAVDAATPASSTTAIDVDVIIVAHNAGPLLEPAVASAAREAGEDRVVVVDAASSDGAVAGVVLAHPRVTAVSAPNDGFAASNNIGIAATSGRYVLLLNPDAELMPGALAALVAYGEAHPRTGVIGAKVLNADGTLQPMSFGTFPSLPQVLSLRLWRLWQRLKGNEGLNPRDFAEPKRVDWTTGAAMLVRRAAIEDAGAMDAGFFLYYEDVEWCHRIRDHGWDVMIEPKAEAVHHLGRSDAPSDFILNAYRESFYRYCDEYGLWGLRLAARVGLSLRFRP